MKRPELLAPAGSREALVAAVANGADAVYLGGTLFNARQSAANFSNQELREAVRFSHRSGVKVYVTVNTLLKDGELPQALEFLQFLYNVGADAVIVQDPGLIAIAREYLPGLELHASTQLTIHNHQGVEALAEMGVKRVVLARELSLNQIEAISKRVSIGLEVFVHGALCVAYSGQCLFSSMAGGRSGNRGLCAQPCRLPYQLDSGAVSSHLLSPKDVCLLPHLERLLSLDVDAWKIEGRLKRPSYVAATVRHYREVRDALLAGRQPGDTGWRVRELSQVFNRGFSTGYALQRPGTALLSEQGPGHQGVVIGIAQSSGEILLSDDVSAGDLLLAPDGSEYIVSQWLLNGHPVEVVSVGTLAMPGRLRYRPGQVVMRLRSQAQEQAVAEQAMGYLPPDLPLRLTAVLRTDEPLQLKAAAAGQSLTVHGSRLPEQAKSVEVTRETLERQLSKLGGSGFQMAELTVELDPGLSLPVSEINQCRRQAVEQLAAVLWGQPNPVPQLPELKAPVSDSASHQTSRSIAVSSMDALRVALRYPFQRIYFGASWYALGIPDLVKQYGAALQACQETGIACYFRLPRIMLPEESDRWAEVLRQHKPQGLLVQNFAGVEIARDLSVPFVLDSSMNITNWCAIESVCDAEACVLSAELNQSEVRLLLQEVAPKVIVAIHARHLLMVHEQCLLGANAACSRKERGCPGALSYLHDRKGYRFPLLSDRMCRSYIYNSQVFSLIEQIGPLPRQGAHELLVDAEMDNAAVLEKTLPLYEAASAEHGRADYQRDALSEVYSGNLTRGHWKRGV